MQVILHDYVGVILGLIRDGSAWRLDPLEVIITTTTKFAQPLTSVFSVRQGP